MIEIKNSPKTAVLISLSNKLWAYIFLGKFKSYDDSYLAFIDSAPSSRQWKKTLFSDDTLENSTVITIKQDYNFTAQAYLFYKNCLCCFSFTTENQEISEKDYLLLDELIKNIRTLIDKSINKKLMRPPRRLAAGSAVRSTNWLINKNDNYSNRRSQKGARAFSTHSPSEKVYQQP